MRYVWTRSHLRESSLRVREVIRGVGVELALSANMSSNTSTVTDIPIDRPEVNSARLE